MSSPDIGLAFIYFNYKEAQSREPKEYVASLLRQLEQRKDTLNSSVENVYDILSPRCQKADMRTLRCLLLDSVKSFTSRTYILLDALDECDEHGRQELVETLWPLFSPDHRVYLLIMTRPTVDMDFLLRRFPKKRQTFNIVAGEGPQSQDLKCYIDNKLSKKRIDDDERSFISQRIIQKAQGLYQFLDTYPFLISIRFLLAGLHLKSVLACKTAKKRERVIKSLPMELNMAYEEEMMRIKTNPDGDEEIARRAFSWIFYAKRPLLMTELREAIAIDPIEDIENGGEGCRDLDPKSLTDPQQIIECCGSLISWERSNNTVGFSHYTISEFFKTKAHGNIEPELCIARTCLTYLCFDVFGQGSCDEWNKLRSRVQKYQLAPYIAEFCGSHILGSKEEKKVKDLVLSIVLSPGRRQALRELEKNNDAIRNGYPFWLDSRDFGGWTPLHFLATWGLAAIFNDLSLNSDSDLVIDLIQKWRYRDSNMVNTIARGLEDLHLNAKSADGATPLYNAAISGHKEIVGLILEKGADVNAKGGVFGNPLQAASWKGYCELADTLLEKGADVNAQGGHYGNALQAASSWGHCRVAEMLLENGANVNAQGGYYVNALYAASQYNHREMVQLLVEAGADVNAQGGEFGNALQVASRYGHREVVQLLLKAGVDVNAQGGYYGNALYVASWRGYREIVQLLVEAGADVTAKGGHYGNALQVASVGGHPEVVRLLVEAGADVYAKGGYFGNALLAASRYGHREVVRLLVESARKIFMVNSVLSM